MDFNITSFVNCASSYYSYVKKERVFAATHDDDDDDDDDDDEYLPGAIRSKDSAEENDEEIEGN